MTWSWWFAHNALFVPVHAPLDALSFWMYVPFVILQLEKTKMGVEGLDGALLYCNMHFVCYLFLVGV